MEVHLYIQNGQTVYEPAVSGSIAWETHRKGQPGKCSFELIPDDKLLIEEGNAVRLDVDGTAVFFGFVFERSWSCDGRMKVTAYDQLRYLKNEDSYNYVNLSAGEVVRLIAGDFNLRVGELEDTGFKIPARNEKDKTLFDIILNALDFTMVATGKIYVLFDDAGRLTLRSAENMKLDLLVNDSTAQDYDFKVSIDGNTFNRILLYCDNDETKVRDTFMTKSSENVNKWGVLQKRESINKGVDGRAMAEAYLSLYNQPVKSLSVKGAFGDIQVRGGCLIPVFLDIRDMQLKNYLLIESVSHKIDGGVHTMDLTLRGAGIYG